MLIAAAIPQVTSIPFADADVGFLRTGIGLGFGFLVTALMAAATYALVTWLGRGRLGPRHPAARRLGTAIVMVSSAVMWVGALALDQSVRWSRLTDHVALAAPMVSLLLLRSRFVRFTSVEALGYGIFLARQCGTEPGRMIRHYRLNAMMLIAPSLA